MANDREFLSSNKHWIRNINAYTEDNKIIIRWDWPDFDTGVNFVYAFSTEDNELPKIVSLEHLLAQAESSDSGINMVRIPRTSKGIDAYSPNYKEIQNCYKKQFILFPAIVTEKNTIFITQTEDNITKVLYKKIDVSVDINYKSVNIFSKYKIAIISFRDKINFSLRIEYVKINKKTHEILCRFPINPESLNREYTILIEKKCMLVLACVNENGEDSTVRFV